jgi:hypothetical protein
VECKLSASELLFVYFAAPPNNDGAVLRISAHDQTVTYTMSIPLAREEAEPDQIETLLVGFYDAVTDAGRRCVAAAGWELEFDQRLRSVSDVLRSIDDISSLVDCLICPSDIDRHNKFAVIWETRTTLLLRRQS